MSTKKRITTFNLDKNLIDTFDAICAAEEKSRSKVANNIFKEFIQAKKNSKK